MIAVVNFSWRRKLSAMDIINVIINDDIYFIIRWISWYIRFGHGRNTILCASEIKLLEILYLQLHNVLSRTPTFFSTCSIFSSNVKVISLVSDVGTKILSVAPLSLWQFTCTFINTGTLRLWINIIIAINQFTFIDIDLLLDHCFAIWQERRYNNDIWNADCEPWTKLTNYKNTNTATTKSSPHKDEPRKPIYLPQRWQIHTQTIKFD